MILLTVFAQNKMLDNQHGYRRAADLKRGLLRKRYRIVQDNVLFSRRNNHTCFSVEVTHQRQVGRQWAQFSTEPPVLRSCTSKIEDNKGNFKAFFLRGKCLLRSSYAYALTYLCVDARLAHHIISARGVRLCLLCPARPRAWTSLPPSELSRTSFISGVAVARRECTERTSYSPT